MPLVQLSEEQVNNLWKDFSDIFNYLVPPDVSVEEFKKELGLRIMTGAYNVWAYIKGNTVAAVLITHMDRLFLVDKSLIIFGIVKTDEFDDKDVEEGFNVLKDFARKNGCKNIIAYTNLKPVLDLAEKTGGVVDRVLLKWEV